MLILMRVYFFTLFLTFVVNLVFIPSTMAAPSTTIKVNPTPLSGESDPSFADKKYLATIEKPPTAQVIFSLGYGGGPYLEKSEYIVSPHVRLSYATLTDELPDLEYSLEINDQNVLGFFFGKRWYCCPGDQFLPYYRLSLGSYFDGNSGLANFAEIRRLRGRAAFGVGRSFFTEIGAGYAATGADYFVDIGYQLQF